jgi:hypothetical protein
VGAGGSQVQGQPELHKQICLRKEKASIKAMVTIFPFFLSFHLSKDLFSILSINILKKVDFGPCFVVRKVEAQTGHGTYLRAAA